VDTGLAKCDLIYSGALDGSRLLSKRSGTTQDNGAGNG